MEILFENIYTDTENMILEQYRVGSRTRRYIWLGVYLVLIIWYIHLILSIGGLSLWAGLVFLLGYAAYLICLPMIRTKRYFKNVKQYHDGKIPQTCVQFINEEIVIQEGRRHFTIPYDKLDKVRLLKYSIVLQAGKMAMVSLRPDGFTKGTREEFIEFLRVKCPQIKLPDWQW